jgi:hypothetical protein
VVVAAVVDWAMQAVTLHEAVAVQGVTTVHLLSFFCLLHFSLLLLS